MESIPHQEIFAGKRVVLFGPESTGKSTMARQLAEHYRTNAVPEFAREYLQHKFDTTGLAAAYEDIVPIAIGQRRHENKAALNARGFLFCDTCPLETSVYSNYYFNKVPAALINAINNSTYDLYLLMDIDLPWVKDDLRDRPSDRMELFNRFEKALQDNGKSYRLVTGLENARFAGALDAIKSTIG